MSGNSDILLLEQLKNGHEKAFTKIFDKYWEKLFLSAYNVLKDED